MNFATLLRPADLMGHLADPNWLVLDCRFELSDPGAGERAWAAGHIPGAVHAHLDRDLSGPVTASTGRHPLPDRGAFAATLSRWGIQPVTQVVAYDASSGMFAARLWWMLRWAGHDRVAVLDGGLQGWTAAGGALDRSVQQRQPVRFEPAWRDDRVVATDELAPMIGRGDCVLVDARGPDRFEGRVEPIDPVAGHVPGAVNHPCQRNLDADGRFLPPHPAYFDRALVVRRLLQLFHFHHPVWRMMNFAQNANPVNTNHDDIVLAVFKLFVRFDFPQTGHVMNGGETGVVVFRTSSQQRNHQFPTSGKRLFHHGPVPFLEYVQRHRGFGKKHHVGQREEWNNHFSAILVS